VKPHYHLRWQSFSSAHDSAQGERSFESDFLDQETEEGWNAVNNRNTFVADRLGYILAITMTVRLRNHQTSTCHQDRESLASGSVESDRRFQQTAVLDRQFQRRRQSIDGINEPRMLDNHALRLSS